MSVFNNTYPNVLSDKYEIIKNTIMNKINKDLICHIYVLVLFVVYYERNENVPPDNIFKKIFENSTENLPTNLNVDDADKIGLIKNEFSYCRFDYKKFMSFYGIYENKNKNEISNNIYKNKVKIGKTMLSNISKNITITGDYNITKECNIKLINTLEDKKLGLEFVFSGIKELCVEKKPICDSMFMSYKTMCNNIIDCYAENQNCDLSIYFESIDKNMKFIDRITKINIDKCDNFNDIFNECNDNNDNNDNNDDNDNNDNNMFDNMFGNMSDL